jgi:multidrug resistance protein MdtO
MATTAQNAMEPMRPAAWFLDFLQKELAPYPGREALVARMVIAATVVMIVSMTFRIPFGVQAAIYALLISRESPRSTVSAASTIVTALAVGTAYVLIGAMVSVGDPMFRLLWIVGSLFVMFFAISAMTDYVAATGFGILVAVTIPQWDLPVSTELKVESTLWVAGQTTIACVVVALIELAATAWRPGDDVVVSLAERLTGVEAYLRGVSDGRRVDEAKEDLTRLGILGTSRLRRILQRSSHSAHHSEQMGAVVALVGRLVDIAANLAYLSIDVSQDDRERMRRLAGSIASIRADLLEGRVPRGMHLDREHDDAPAVPLYGGSDGGQGIRGQQDPRGFIRASGGGEPGVSFGKRARPPLGSVADISSAIPKNRQLDDQFCG